MPAIKEMDQNLMPLGDARGRCFACHNMSRYLRGEEQVRLGRDTLACC